MLALHSLILLVLKPDTLPLSVFFFPANPLPGLIEWGGNLVSAGERWERVEGLSTVALARIVGDTSLHPYHPAVHIGRSLLSEPPPTVSLRLLFPFSSPSQGSQCNHSLQIMENCERARRTLSDLSGWDTLLFCYSHD